MTKTDPLRKSFRVLAAAIMGVLAAYLGQKGISFTEAHQAGKYPRTFFAPPALRSAAHWQNNKM